MTQEARAVLISVFAKAEALFEQLWAKQRVRFIFYSLLGLWAIAADPFRLSSATDQAIGEAYSDIYSRTTPVGMPPLTVVTIDGQSIDELFNGGRGKLSVSDWPISYTDHAAIITRIAKGKPNPPVAIFYDILFEKPRLSSGNLGHLNRRIELVQQVTGIPIFLASGGPDMPLSEESNRILTAPRFVRTNWHEEAGIYPLVFEKTGHSVAGFADSGQGVMALSPAMSLYQVYCQSLLSCGNAFANQGYEQRSLKIHWPMRLASEDPGGSAECLADSAAKRYIQIGWRVTKELFEALLNTSGPRPASVNCLPINTIQVSDLFSDNNPIDLAPPGLGEGMPYIVMVGVTMPSAGDYHETPVYGKLPGVLFHASAFENLHRMQGDYFYHKDLTWFSVMFWIFASFSLMAHARYRQTNPITSPIPVLLIWWAVLIFSVLIMQAVFTHIFRIVPEGWLSMVAILPLLREVVMRHEAAFFERQEKNK